MRPRKWAHLVCITALIDSACNFTLKVVDRIWSRFLWLLMAGAALYVALILGAIMYQTIFRTMGWHYSPLGFVLVEYGFVYALFLGSPWLIRERGHIYIEILTAMLGSLGACSPIAVYRHATCATICFIWMWYSLQLLLNSTTTRCHTMSCAPSSTSARGGDRGIPVRLFTDGY